PRRRYAFPSRAPLLRLETLEDRSLPSTTIPLSGVNWTDLGPAPIAINGAAPGPLPSSGRLTGVAADPVDPNTFWVSAAGGGIAKTTDGGHTWAHQTDHLTHFNNIA